MDVSGDDLIERFGLQPHPEGGHYRETWRGPGPGRPSGTAILFLLRAGEVSRWHRIDATEIWHFYRGDALELSLFVDDAVRVEHLGPDQPQVIIPPGVWQSARPLGDHTLVGCTVSPGFSFDHFELAPEGWEPDG